MGIRKKIILGFILIGILLLLSGVLASVELAKLNSATAERIKENEQCLALTKKLVDALGMKNDAVIRSLKDPAMDVYDSIICVSDSEFDKTLLILKTRPDPTGRILRIEAANSRFNDILNVKERDFGWLVNVYSDSYARVTNTVRDYMISQQDEFQKYAATLESNVYRALMVGIIALVSGALLLGAFYLMIDVFFLSPVLKIDMALREFLKANITYSVKIETQDELRSLSDNVADVCTKARKNNAQKA